MNPDEEPMVSMPALEDLDPETAVHLAKLLNDLADAVGVIIAEEMAKIGKILDELARDTQKPAQQHGPPTTPFAHRGRSGRRT